MDDIYKQAISMQNKFRQYVDLPNHEVANQLKTEIQRLTDEIESNKNPRTIEDRVKNIMRLLERGENDKVMDHQHSDDLQDMCRDLQQDLRKIM